MNSVSATMFSGSVCFPLMLKVNVTMVGTKIKTTTKQKAPYIPYIYKKNLEHYVTTNKKCNFTK